MEQKAEQCVCECVCSGGIVYHSLSILTRKSLLRGKKAEVNQLLMRLHVSDFNCENTLMTHLQPYEAHVQYTALYVYKPACSYARKG